MPSSEDSPNPSPFSSVVVVVVVVVVTAPAGDEAIGSSSARGFSPFGQNGACAWTEQWRGSNIHDVTACSKLLTKTTNMDPWNWLLSCSHVDLLAVAKIGASIPVPPERGNRDFNYATETIIFAAFGMISDS